MWPVSNTTGTAGSSARMATRITLRTCVRRTRARARVLGQTHTPPAPPPPHTHKPAPCSILSHRTAFPTASWSVPAVRPPCVERPCWHRWFTCSLYSFTRNGFYSLRVILCPQRALPRAYTAQIGRATLKRPCDPKKTVRPWGPCRPHGLRLNRPRGPRCPGRNTMRRAVLRNHGMRRACRQEIILHGVRAATVTRVVHAVAVRTAVAVCACSDSHPIMQATQRRARLWSQSTHRAIPALITRMEVFTHRFGSILRLHTWI